MINDEYFLFTFDSTHAAIHAQKIFDGLDIVVIPTLRQITASCGISIRIDSNHVDEAKNRLLDSTINPSLFKLYKVKVSNNITECTEI